MAISRSGNTPNYSTQPSQDFDDNDFETFETDAINQEEYNSYAKDLKAVFTSREVEAISPEDIQKQLPKYTGPISEHQQNAGLSTVRKISRFFSKARRLQTVQPINVRIPPKDFQPSLIPETPLEETPPPIFVSDDKLVENMGMSGKAFIREDTRPIFEKEPNPVDVQQCDKRSTCYVMSMLAAYAASPTGKKILEAMVQPDGENLALVTFYDPLTEKNIQVRVSTSRLVDKNGKDLYSFGNPTNTRWAGIIEKAYHAYKLSRSQALKVVIEEARAKKDDDRANYYTQELRKIVPLDARRSLLDWGDPLQSVSCIPKLPEMTERPGPKYSYQFDYLKKFLPSDLKDTDALANLKYNVELGVPATLGTLKSAFRALSTGTPTNHAIAVAGPAVILNESTGQMHEGVLVYDQYGALLDGGVEINANNPVLARGKMPRKTDLTSLDGGVEVNEKKPVFASDGTLQKTDLTSSWEEINLVSPTSETTIDNEEPVDLENDMEPIQNDLIAPILTKAGGRSLRFYRYDELHKYFDSGVLARGFYN